MKLQSPSLRLRSEGKNVFKDSSKKGRTVSLVCHSLSLHIHSFSKTLHFSRGSLDVPASTTREEGKAIIVVCSAGWWNPEISVRALDALGIQIPSKRGVWGAFLKG